jgi:hypothetical protein
MVECDPTPVIRAVWYPKAESIANIEAALLLKK